MGLFLNLIELSERATDDALEYIYKAHSHDGDGEGMWKPHESKLIRRLIELFSQRGLDRLDAVKKEIEAWSQGLRHVPHHEPVALPPGSVVRWTSAELQLAKIYLEALPPAAWTLDDHMLAIDLVVHQYLAPDALTSEAEWLAVRAGLMGKVQANLAADPSTKQADAILASMPSTVGAAVQQFALQAAEKSALDFARVRCVENVRALSDTVRHKMRGVVLDHLEQQQAGAGGSSLQSKLLDTFGVLNRDWRRIAITEAGEAQLQGLIASLKPGARVKRVEQYEGACSFCRGIDGRVATVVEAGKPDKDAENEVWPGKNNVGRSASPRKRVGDVLMEREPHELWQLPAGLVHPNCRGRWIVLEDTTQPGDDPGFANWLASALK